MTTGEHQIKPRRGMSMAFKANASRSLAGIPATVIDIWPRFRSGDYLVTLEYATPVPFRKTLIRHIDAFVTELDLVEPAQVALPTANLQRAWRRTMSRPR
ncbi:MAG TPA: hypothetical protein VFZ66_02700 [Herpetosiphonaceae bacterium]